MIQNEDDEDSVSPFCDGAWEWDRGELVFVKNLPPLSKTVSASSKPTFITPAEFRADLDILEQERYKKRYQRIPDGDDDVVTLQDVKDFVLYTAPKSLVTLTMINVLHTATTERFLRALIVYCQYYLEMTQIMKERTLELETKISTNNGRAIEAIYQENLEDLRRLIAKEYSTMILGFNEFRKFHHMGKDKKLKSSSEREMNLFEPLIRIAVQIVWVALARKNKTEIELEVHRLFRAKKFNLMERHLHINVDATMNNRQRSVIRGKCISSDRVKAFDLHSPLYDQINCISDADDFKIMGLGVIKYNKLNERLQYFNDVLVKPEKYFLKLNITMGIIGLPRCRFDPTLNEIKLLIGDSKTDINKSSSTKPKSKDGMSKKSGISTSSKKSTYPTIRIPPKTMDPLPESFPQEKQRNMTINRKQHKMWINKAVQKFLYSDTKSLI